MTTNNKKIAIVILNWNGSALMQKFLPSVLRYSQEDLADVIVADNGSTDDSLQMLTDKFPSVKIIRLEKNFGFAEGYNQALKQIDYPYTVLLNSDVEVAPNWLDAPFRMLEDNQDIAAVQPKIKAEQHRNLFEYAGASGGFMDIYGYPFCRGRLLHIVEEDKDQYNEPIDILWATGACLFIRTNIYKEAGGLDSGFFAHQEEIDLCWRLRSRGYRLVCTPQSVIYHVGGGTLNAESPRKTFLNFRNNLLMLYKNLPEDKLHRVMNIRRILDYVAATKFFLCGHPQNAWAVYQARREFHKLKSTYKSKREENIRRTTLHNIPELKTYSLLWQFYIKGRKHYSDLPQ